jgi:hypothetical protein
VISGNEQGVFGWSEYRPMECDYRTEKV